MGIEQYGIVNDVHFPEECEKTWRLMIKVWRSLPRLKRIILNGDIVEFESVSSHAKRPDGVKFLKEEIEYTNVKLDELRKHFPGVPITYISGNHEYRLDRYLQNSAPELFGLFDCKMAFEIYARPYMTWIPYDIYQYYRCGKANLYLMHEPTNGGQVHSKGTAENVEKDTAYGHTHTIQSYTHKRKGGQRVRTYALPAACDFKSKVMGYRGPKAKWVNGFTVVEAETKTGAYSLECVETTGGVCIYRGKQYKA